MLHMRSRMVRPFSTSWPSLRDLLATSDQGLLRLQMAVRGTLSVFLAGLLAVVAGRALGFSPVECASGVTLCMMAPFLMREPTRRQRQRTLLMLALPTVASAVLTTLLHGYGIAGDSFFLVLVFLCFLVGPTSPLATGMGLVAVVMTYVGLYLELPPATLPVQIGAVVAAVPILELACFVLVPMDAAATLRRSVATVKARAAQVIRQAGTLEGVTPQSPDELARLRGSVLRLNQAALAADDQLALFEPGLASAVRAQLVQVELCTTRLIEILQTERLDRRHAARLKLHARRIERGGRYATQPAQFPPGTLLAALVALGNATHGLGRALAAQPSVNRASPQAAPIVGKLAWRVATRATLAAGLAMAGGMALSPQRWSWAVITVYVVFLNVRSRGDTIYKGVQRLGGTLLGIVGGIAIATALSGDPVLETITLLLSIFGMYYFFAVSYTVGIFFLTVMLGLLYGMLGAPLDNVLVLRLEETAVGAVAAIVVAALSHPNPTSEQVRQSGRAVITELAAVVRCCADALAGDATANPAYAMRQVDRNLADLRLALAPVVAGRAVLRRSAVERPVPALLDCVYWTRLLAAEVQAHSGSPCRRLVTGLQQAALHLEAISRGQLPATKEWFGDGEEGDLKEVTANLNRAITTLAERLALGTYETFAIDP